jgi:hypothetical protein
MVTIFTIDFNVQSLCILLTESTFVFGVILIINSNCFAKQH